MITYPDKTKKLSEQKPETLLAMAIFGEARGEDSEAKFAVASVIRNRVYSNIKFWKKGKGETNWHRVILHPFAFSSFNKDDPNLKKLLDPLKWEEQITWDECCIAAEAVFEGIHSDPTDNSDHYFDDSISAPIWANKGMFVRKIGRLNFYRLYLRSKRQLQADS